MPGIGRYIFFAWIGLIALAAGAGSASAENSIKVLVNDEPITTYDLDQRAHLMTLAGEKGGEKAALDQLIDERLELQEAKTRGLAIPDNLVDGAFASIAKTLKPPLSGEQFTKALATRGVDASTLKNRLRAQLAWQELVKARTRRQATIKPSDVTAALLAKGSPEAITEKEFTLQQIVFVVPKGSSAAYIDQRRREAEAYRLRYTGCDNAIELAKTLRDVAVRDLGRRQADDLTGPRGEDVKATLVGKTSRPDQTDQGIELIAVCSTRDIQSNATARSDIESKFAVEQSKTIATAYLKELHDKAIIQNR